MADDREVSIRITAKNLTADEFAKVQAGVSRLKDEAAKLGSEGAPAASKLSLAVRDLIPQTNDAHATFTSFKGTLAEMWDNPTAGVQKFASAAGKDLASGLNLAGGGLATVAVGGAAATAALAVGAAAAYQLAAGAAKVGAELDDMADTTGMTVPTLAGLKFAADVTGASLNQITDASFKLQTAVAQGGETVSQGFKRIGMSVEAIQQLEPDQQFLATARALNAIEDPGQRAAAAVEIFGKQGRDLLPLFANNLDELVTKSRDLGFTWSTEEAAAAEEFENKSRELKLTLSNLSTVIGKDLIPLFNLGLNVSNWTVAKLITEGPPKQVFGELERLKTYFEVINRLMETNAKLRLTTGGPAIVSDIPPPPPPPSPYKNTAKEDFAATTRAMTEQTIKAAELQAHLRQLHNAVVPLDAAQRLLARQLIQGGDSAKEAAQWLDVSEVAVKRLVEADKKAEEQTKRTTEERKKTIQQVRELEVITPGLRQQVGALDDTELKAVKTWLAAAAALDKVEQNTRFAQFGFKGLQQELLNVGQAVPVLSAQQQALSKNWDLIAANSRVSLQRQADEARAVYRYMAARSDEFSKETIAHFKQIADEADRQAGRMQTSWTSKLAGMSGAVSQFASLFGGDFARIANAWAMAARAADDYSRSEKTATDKMMLAAQAAQAVAGATNAGSTKSRAAGGAIAGAQAGMAFGPWGAAVGAGVGALVGFFRGQAAEKAVNRVREVFVQSAGGLEVLNQKVMQATGSLSLVKQLLNARTEQEYSAAVEQINASLKTFSERAGKVYEVVTAVGDRMRSQTEMTPALAASLQRVYDAKNPTEYETALAGVNAALDEQDANAKRVDAAMQKYGITWDQLGDKARAAKLGQTTKELGDDFQVLLDAGVDVNLVMEKMGDKVRDVVKRAHESGTEVPESFRRIIQVAIDAGQVFDENGDKITDITKLGLIFGTTQEDVGRKIVDGFDKVVAKFEELFQKIGAVTGRINAIPRGVDVDVNARLNWREGDEPDVPGHARGGVFHREHIARIAEGGESEIVGGQRFMRQAIAGALADLRRNGAPAAVGGGSVTNNYFIVDAQTGQQRQISEHEYRQIQQRMNGGGLTVPASAIRGR